MVFEGTSESCSAILLNAIVFEVREKETTAQTLQVDGCQQGVRSQKMRKSRGSTRANVIFCEIQRVRKECYLSLRLIPHPYPGG
jgi:hypothetical protein